MSRICLIGDSHIGVLQSATRDHPLRRVCQLTFFACHLELVTGLMLAGRTLVAENAELAEKLRQSSGGLDRIEIDAYDRFVIVGHGFDIHSLIRCYHHFSADSLPGPVGNKYLLSDECFVKMGEQLLQKRPALKMAITIRALCDKPITIIPSPNASEGFPEANLPGWFPPYHDVIRNGDDVAIGALFREVCARLAKNNRVQVIPPLPEAAANGVFNKFEYSRLNGEVINGNLLNAMVHANCLYGRLLLPHLFEPAELSAS